jgi:hypothetical protein
VTTSVAGEEDRVMEDQASAEEISIEETGDDAEDLEPIAEKSKGSSYIEQDPL